MPDPIDIDARTAADPIECAAELVRDESQDRLWLRAIVPILQLRDGEGTAYDLMFIAACDRVCRILRADLDR